MNTTPNGIVYVVDDEPGIRSSLQRLLEQIGLPARSCASAREFLDCYDPTQPGCLVLDVRMPGLSGMDLQRQLIDMEITLPIIIITGHGDVAMAVEALKLGALDFVEKPFRPQPLLDRIQQGLRVDAENLRRQGQLDAIEERFGRLTERELSIVRHLVAGKTNKQIAAHFGVTVQAIDASRRKAMGKLEASSIAELVILSRELEESRQRSPRTPTPNLSVGHPR